jgi:hypothetical protein
MKITRILHLGLTLLLATGLVGFGILILAGQVEVRWPAKQQGKQQPTSGGEGVKARLLVVRGVKPNMEYPIYEGRNVIGRADKNPVEIDLEFQESPDRIWSSRQHAVLTWESGELFVEDLN